MVQVAFSELGFFLIDFLSVKKNEIKYTDTLRKVFLPFYTEKHVGNWLYEQDNASIQTAGILKEFFPEHNVSVMPWPAKNCDLSPVEKV